MTLNLNDSHDIAIGFLIISTSLLVTRIADIIFKNAVLHRQCLDKANSYATSILISFVIISGLAVLIF